MRITRFLTPFAAAALIISVMACARATAATTQAPGARAPTSRAATSEPLATTVAVPGAPRPWYADRLEKLGFYVFPAPVDVGDFTVEALKGGTTTLSQAKGKIVLLNFWATWCPPCRAEMPSIQTLSKKMKDRAFAIIAVSVGEDRPVVTKFIAEQKYDYPIFLDPTSKLGSAFNASSIPTTYLIDKSGKVIAGIQGSKEYDSPELVALFQELAAK